MTHVPRPESEPNLRCTARAICHASVPGLAQTKPSPPAPSGTIRNTTSGADTDRGRRQQCEWTPDGRRHHRTIDSAGRERGVAGNDRRVFSRMASWQHNSMPVACKQFTSTTSEEASDTT
eukprot:6198031-Pleurochrysis_carterae.AAC.1